MFNNQELLQFVIISFILMTSMRDSWVVLRGEISVDSLLKFSVRLLTLR